MVTKDDGGAAFPELTGGSRWESHDGDMKYAFDTDGGMSMRDYFAANAMAAVMTTTDSAVLLDQARKRDITVTRAVAVMAYEIADAMLAERAKDA